MGHCHSVIELCESEETQRKHGPEPSSSYYDWFYTKQPTSITNCNVCYFMFTLAL